jgi:cytochrome c oxidase cbb3-type subunit III
MHPRYGALAAFAIFALVLTQAAAQTPPQQAPPAPQTPAPEPPGAPAGRGQGRGRGQRPATFPAQQRPPGDPVLIERGRGIYTVNCTACHGADLRGGQLGGPNLLRSLVVLNDQKGELILPIIRGSRAERGMPPLPLPDNDVEAVAEYIHSVVATSGGQGSPPPSDAPPPNIVIGDASAGQAAFAAKCASCHSPTGDLQGLATRIADPKALQNAWVSGGAVSGRGRGQAAAARPRRPITATVTLPSGEKVTGRLLRVDHFLVSLEQEDGTQRSFRRSGDQPRVDIDDPRAGHNTLLTTMTEKEMHDLTAYLVTLK